MAGLNGTYRTSHGPGVALCESGGRERSQQGTRGAASGFEVLSSMVERTHTGHHKLAVDGVSVGEHGRLSAHRKGPDH